MSTPREVIVISPEYKDWTSFLSTRIGATFAATNGVRYISRIVFGREMSRWQAYRLVVAAAAVAAFVTPDRRRLPQATTEKMVNVMIKPFEKYLLKRELEAMAGRTGSAA